MSSASLMFLFVACIIGLIELNIGIKNPRTRAYAIALFEGITYIS